MAKLLPAEGWLGRYEEIALLSVDPLRIEEKLDCALVEGDEPGMGKWLATGGRLRSGATIELIRYENSPVQGFVLRVDSSSDAAASLAEVMDMLSLDAGALKWVR